MRFCKGGKLFPLFSSVDICYTDFRYAISCLIYIHGIVISMARAMGVEFSVGSVLDRVSARWLVVCSYFKRVLFSRESSPKVQHFWNMCCLGLSENCWFARFGELIMVIVPDGFRVCCVGCLVSFGHGKAIRGFV